MVEEALSPSNPVVLYIWPSIENVPSYDPACLTALLFLQIAIKGRFTVEYCADPDASPSGQLPFLTHGALTLAGLAPILAYVVKLDGASDPDTRLSNLEKAQLTARIAHVESELGDLTAHILYSFGPNWHQKVRPSISTMLPIPQRYYVPERLRNSYKPRLEAAGLWSASTSETDNDETRSAFQKISKPKRKDKQAKQKAKKAFEREKVFEKARTVLDCYTKLLGNRSFFFGDRPSSLDLVFSAHIRLMLQPLPEPLLQSLLIESYPSLVTLTDTTFGLAFPDSDPPFPTAVGSKSILPSFASLLPRARLFSWQKRQTLSDSKEEKRFRVARWGFFGLSVVVLVGYVQFIGLIPAVSAAIAKTRAELEESREVAEEDDDGDEEYDDGDEEEGEGPTEQEE